MINNTLNGLYNNMNAMNKTYAQMVTGKKIQTVSDDPIIAGRALKLKTTVLETNQYEGNTKEAMSWMEVTEGALKNMNKILESIRTKCVQASTGTLEKQDKEVLQQDIEELVKQLQEEANVTYGGRYVFSGYKTDEPLILTKDKTLEIDCEAGADLQLPDGTTFKKGDIIPAGTVIPAGTLNPMVNGKIEEQFIDYEIGVNSTIPVNTLGMDKIFADIMTAVSEIDATLKDDTKTSEDIYKLFDSKIKEFDDILEKVSKENTDLGSRMSRVVYTQERLAEQKITFQNLLSETEDIDIEEVYVKFNTQYAAYQSALQATSKVIMNTLADYL